MVNAAPVGVFDVSHLGRFTVTGEGATALLLEQLCNDIRNIEPWRAQYTMALNESGGIEDDIIVWQLEAGEYWVIPNGVNSDGIIEQFRGRGGTGRGAGGVRLNRLGRATPGQQQTDERQRPHDLRAEHRLDPIR